jgi:hypothetical protein
VPLLSGTEIAVPLASNVPEPVSHTPSPVKRPGEIALPASNAAAVM